MTSVNRTLTLTHTRKYTCIANINVFITDNIIAHQESYIAAIAITSTQICKPGGWQINHWIWNELEVISAAAMPLDARCRGHRIKECTEVGSHPQNWLVASCGPNCLINLIFKPEILFRKVFAVDIEVSCVLSAINANRRSKAALRFTPEVWEMAALLTFGPPFFILNSTSNDGIVQLAGLHFALSRCLCWARMPRPKWNSLL